MAARNIDRPPQLPSGRGGMGYILMSRIRAAVPNASRISCCGTREFHPLVLVEVDAQHKLIVPQHISVDLTRIRRLRDILGPTRWHETQMSFRRKAVRWMMASCFST